jgi:hypothetical protein
MTLLSVIQNAAVRIGIARPTQVFGSTDRTMYDVQAVIAGAVDAIREVHDWQVLKTLETYTGDGVSTTFDLPSDYDRMLVTASIWSSRYNWAVNHILDTDLWLQLVTLPYTQATGSWTIYGGQFHIMDTMASTETAKFFYISNQIVRSSTGTGQNAFLADTDLFRLDEELLRLAFIWRWKQEKGRDYAEDMSNYEIKLAQAIGKDGGSKPIVTGTISRSWRDRGVTWPGTISPFPG